MHNKKTYKVTDYTIQFSNNSAICPSNDCKFVLNTGEFSPSMLVTGGYLFTGRLKVSEPSESKFYEVFGDFDLIKENTTRNTITKLYKGSLDLNTDQYQYQVTNATLVLTEGKNPILKILAQR